MKKVKFSLILSALIALTVTQSSAKAIAPWDFPLTHHANKFIPLRARTGKQITLTSKAATLDDVTFTLSNYYDHNFEIWFFPYVGDDYYYVNVPSYQSGQSLDIPVTFPAGFYDISIAPNDVNPNPQHHFYTIGCDLYWGGFGPYVFEHVSLPGNLSCTRVTFE